METAALILAVVALLFAVVAMARAKAVANEAQDSIDDAKRMVRNLEEQLEAETLLTRRLLATVHEGGEIDREMILTGRTWADVNPEAGARMLDEKDVFILDVRTARETAMGIVPGAKLIPVDELEQRLAEVQKAKKTLVYCAGGGRSAAACEFLASKGYDGLFNLSGGFSSWSGPTAKPE